jgi:hypothetical protein
MNASSPRTLVVCAMVHAPLARCSSVQCPAADGSVAAALRYRRTRLPNLPAERQKGAAYFGRSAFGVDSSGCARYNFGMVIVPFLAVVVTNGMSMDAPLERAKIVKLRTLQPAA